MLLFSSIHILFIFFPIRSVFRLLYIITSDNFKSLYFFKAIVVLYNLFSGINIFPYQCLLIFHYKWCWNFYTSNFSTSVISFVPHHAVNYIILEFSRGYPHTLKHTYISCLIYKMYMMYLFPGHIFFFSWKLLLTYKFSFPLQCSCNEGGFFF